MTQITRETRNQQKDTGVVVSVVDSVEAKKKDVKHTKDTLHRSSGAHVLNM